MTSQKQKVKYALKPVFSIVYRGCMILIKTFLETQSNIT